MPATVPPEWPLGQPVHAHAEAVKGEVLALEAKAGHLVRFLAGGGDSPTVRDELRMIESALAGFRVELAELDRTTAVAPPQLHRTWILARLAQLDELLQKDPVRAKLEIAKHLDANLRSSLAPRSPASAGRTSPAA